MPSEPETTECKDAVSCTDVSCEDGALNDLIRRALEARIKRDARRPTPAEVRAQVERRMAQGLPHELDGV